MTDTVSAILPRIQASFDRQTMMQTFGARLVAAADGRCTIRAPILPGVRQQHGVAHGAFPFGLGDSAAGYAALTTLPDAVEVMTIEMKINYLAPAIGEALEARGTVLRAGRRVIVVRAEVAAIDGTRRRAVAELLGTMIPLEAG
jgi:uncharacterized protein (TIGR00369 family)